MAEHVVVTRSPLIPVGRRGSVLAMVLVMVLALGAGTVLGTVLASDSSVTHRAVPAPTALAASPAVGSRERPCCRRGRRRVSVDADRVDAQRRRDSDRDFLSPQVQQLVSDAAFSGQYVDWSATPTPTRSRWPPRSRHSAWPIARSC